MRVVGTTSDCNTKYRHNKVTKIMIALDYVATSLIQNSTSRIHGAGEIIRTFISTIKSQIMQITRFQ